MDSSSFTEEILLDNNAKKRAFHIRRDIMKIPRKKLTDKITLDDIYSGYCDLPTSLINLLNYIIIGPRSRYADSEKKSRLVQSIASDIVYAVNNGNLNPAKHLQLGIVLKNCCSQRKTLDIVNHLGHCVSYNVAEELETELTCTASNGNIIPAEFKLV